MKPLTRHFPIHSNSALKIDQLSYSIGITKQFFPILSLLRIFGMHPLKFTEFEDPTGRMTNRVKVHCCVNFRSKAFIISISSGLVWNLLYILLFQKEMMRAALIPDWLYVELTS
jgi:hypothetical protein